MSSGETKSTDIRGDGAETDACARNWRPHVAEIEGLNEELAETNKGVVALYAELDDKAEQLRQASELKSRFLSYMSHEFRTPLGSILSIVRVLQDRMDGPLTSEQEKQIQFIRTSATELSEMVQDLLDLAKVEAGRITVSPAWFEMVDLFSALRGMFRPIVDTESVDLIFEEPADVPRIYTDHKKLSQILRNFISNALKFTLRGEVRVTARRVEGDKVMFSVADTGIGIPKRCAGGPIQRFRSDRFSDSKAASRNGPGPVTQQEIRRSSRGRCIGHQRAWRGFHFFHHHSRGDRKFARCKRCCT